MKRILATTIIAIFTLSIIGSSLSCIKKAPDDESTGEPGKETPQVFSIFDPTLPYVPPLRLPQEFKVRQVVSVEPDGNLKLNDGDTVGYVGIILPDEGTPIYNNAISFITDEVKGKEVLIAYDPRIASQEKGLAYIFYDIPPDLRKASIEMKTQGKLLNTQLLGEGLASIEPKPSFKRKKEFEAYQAKAEAQKKGVWAGKS